MSDNPFKDYTHKRLDAMGVPVDPSPSVTASTGCRIHGRLDYLQLRIAGAVAMEVIDVYTPAPCRFCGVVVMWTGLEFNSVNDGEVNKHLCKTSDINTFKKLKGKV